MIGWVRNPLLNAGALIFPPPTAPARHTPTFRPEGVTLRTGEAWCPGCDQVVTTAQVVAAEPCPGKASR